MISILHRFELIVTNTVTLSKQPSAVFPKAGVASDFEWWIFGTLGTIAFLLCAFNYLFLRRHQISKEQLENDYHFNLVRQRRAIMRTRFRPWQRILIHLSCKIGFVVAAYSLSSALQAEHVWIGCSFAAGFIALNSTLLMRSVLHPRSVFHRRYLLFRKSPAFIRTRLFFELGRRFVYFVLGFALLSYSLHRLTGDAAQFQLQTHGVSLFVAHLKSTVSDMTSLGNDPISYVGNIGLTFQLGREIFAFLLLLTFVNLVVSCLTSSGSDNVTETASPTPDLAQGFNEDLSKRDDAVAMVILVIEQWFGIPAAQIKENTHLIADLGADSLDCVEIQLRLEQAFECTRIPGSEIDSKKTVAELSDLFWHYYQKQPVRKTVNS